jgi:hypothetical protein
MTSIYITEDKAGGLEDVTHENNIVSPSPHNIMGPVFI